MRLTRRPSLLVALCLLTSAATAHAECAWVLWAGTSTDRAPFDTGWVLVTAYETRRECQAELTERVVQDRAMWQASGVRVIGPREKGSGRFIRLTEKGYVYTDTDSKHFLITTSDCLPDTVDPRGPKTK